MIASCQGATVPDAGIFQLAPDLPDARREQIYLPWRITVLTAAGGEDQAHVEHRQFRGWQLAPAGIDTGLTGVLPSADWASAAVASK